MRINDEVDTNKDELLDERQSTAQKPKRDRNTVKSLLHNYFSNFLNLRFYFCKRMEAGLKLIEPSLKTYCLRGLRP